MKLLRLLKRSRSSRPPAQPISQEQKLRVLGRGFASGIVLSLGIAGCLLLGIHMTNAQGMVDPPADPASQQTTTPPAPPAASGPFTDTTPVTPAPPAPVTPLAANQPATGNYVALGDSVAAGLGLPAGTNANGSQCGRSPQAYAYQVAAAVGKPLNHIACSGATAGDLFTKQGVSGPNITPQLDQAYANGNQPGLMTITAGANDAQWSNFVQKCYATTCGTSFDNAIFKTALIALEAKLYYAFYNIQVRSASAAAAPPRVVVTGYYNPVSSQCATVSQGKLTANEIAWVTSSLNSLNQTIQSVAAKFDFVRYAAVNFSGHDLCSADPWIQGQDDPAPVHPTAAGQTAIARSVITAAQQ